MKLINKLLPIAAIGASAAVVTPLVTSCGNGLTMFDGEKIFVPTIAPAQPDEEKIETDGGYTATDVTNVYFEDLAKNPQIFEQDMYYVLSTGFFRQKHTAAAVYNLTKINVGLKYSNMEVNKTKHTLSYEIELQADLCVVGTSGKTLMLYADGLVFHAWLKNIPYICRELTEIIDDTPTIVGWDFRADLGQSALETASIRFIGNGTIIGPDDYRWNFTGKDITIDKNYKKLSYEDKLEAEAAELLFGQLLSRTGDAGSYHLTKLLPGIFENP